MLLRERSVELPTWLPRYRHVRFSTSVISLLFSRESSNTMDDDITADATRYSDQSPAACSGCYSGLRLLFGPQIAFDHVYGRYFV